jgi:hypothetical protein
MDVDETRGPEERHEPGEFEELTPDEPTLETSSELMDLCDAIADLQDLWAFEAEEAHTNEAPGAPARHLPRVRVHLTVLVQHTAAGAAQAVVEMVLAVLGWPVVEAGTVEEITSAFPDWRWATVAMAPVPGSPLAAVRAACDRLGGGDWHWEHGPVDVCARWPDRQLRSAQVVVDPAVRWMHVHGSPDAP